MVTAYLSGGTDFEKPLTWALEKIKEPAFKQADVVVVTDGDSAVGDDFLKEYLSFSS